MWIWPAVTACWHISCSCLTTEYENIISISSLKTSSEASIYKIGLELNLKPLVNLKSILMLAMNPSLQVVDFSQNNLEFSLRNYVGRIIYGGEQKNYKVLVKQRKEKTRETLLEYKKEAKT